MTGDANPCELLDVLRDCLDVPRWTSAVLAAQGDAAGMLSAAAAAADPLTPGEVHRAMAAHPPLGGAPHVARDRSARADQAGISGADPSWTQRMADANRAYQERFGHVFVIRASGRSQGEILAEIERRMQLDEAEELAETGRQLREIGLVRLRRALAEHPPLVVGATASSPRSLVTTHVLDTARGRPAAGIPVTLEKWHDGEWIVLDRGSTDADGRIGRLGPTRMDDAVLRLGFFLRDYLTGTDQPVFFPEAQVTFIVSGQDEHYHVPLLLSPFGWQTYRGS